MASHPVLSGDLIVLDALFGQHGADPNLLPIAIGRSSLSNDVLTMWRGKRGNAAHLPTFPTSPRETQGLDV
jgi:hypothetical protein